MKVGFIGAGKAGFSLGKYFKEKGLSVSGYYSIPEKDAIEAARFTNTDFFSSAGDLVFFSDIIFITTPDSEIKGVWQEIKEYDISEKTICHVSGALGADVFTDESKGADKRCSLHPLLAFSSRKESWKELEHATFSIEGTEEGKDSLLRITKELENEVINLGSEKKAEYHLASVMASNAVVAMFDMAVRCFLDCGFSEASARKALRSLFEANAHNVALKGAKAALTGPCERGDAETVKKHFKYLDGDDRELYKLISLRLVKIAEKKNPEKDYKDLKKLLEDI